MAQGGECFPSRTLAWIPGAYPTVYVVAKQGGCALTTTLEEWAHVGTRHSLASQRRQNCMLRAKERPASKK